MYRAEGRYQEAEAALLELREGGYLNASELCTLAQLQARLGNAKGAFETLQQVQEADPDDLEAKSVEAEALLVKGDEELALKLLNQLIEEHPDLWQAALVRARYHFNREALDLAQEDLSRIDQKESLRPEVVSMQARVMMARHQPEDAERILQEAVDRSRKNALLLAQLAEVKIDLKKMDEAEEIIEAALGLRPDSNGARYVQGRLVEARGDRAEAIRIYQSVLKADPTMVPALARLWPLFMAENRSESMSLLERLLQLDAATIREKATLGELYIDFNTKLVQALRLLEEAVRHDPRNAHYVAQRDRVRAILAKRPRKITIIRGRPHA
jgi:tetratricopeptide (TPR) repeat protein